MRRAPDSRAPPECQQELFMRMVRSLAPVLMRGLCLAGALFSAGAALAQERDLGVRGRADF